MRKKSGKANKKKDQLYLRYHKILQFHTHSEKNDIKFVTLKMKHLFSYWALKNHGDSLLLFHHVKILAKVRCHISLSQIFWVIFINSIKIPLFMRGCCWRWWSHHPHTRITIHSTVLRNLWRRTEKRNK